MSKRRFSNFKVRIAVVAATLIASGALALPLQTHLTTLRKDAGFNAPSLDLTLREQVGQLSFLAALSGFRSFVAAWDWIQAHIAWQDLEWGRMAGLIDTVTTLQPHSELYWDNGSWHMAWNAAVNARNNVDDEPSEILRLRNERQYVELGRSLLEKGILNNPDSQLLHQRLGLLLSQRAEDHCAAADAYAASAALPGAPPYVKRLAAYELAQCPEREQEAYRALRELYDLGTDERMPTVITRLKELEEKLGIPPADRIGSAPNP
ncbi:MAG: hypothetical protein WA771_09825 [Chthoniobacterales bacterium]